MLSACNGSAATDAAWTAAPDPIVEVRHERTIECPADLDVAPAARPTPSTDAVVEYNPAGALWLAEVIGWAEGIAARLTDARAECARLKAAS